MNRIVATSYYMEPLEDLPYVIELTFDDCRVGEQRRYADISAWSAAIDDLGIRYEEVPAGLVRVAPRSAWHPSYPLASDEVVS